MVGKKALTNCTKEFKKILDEEKLTAFKGLLKAYQTEVDSLTKHSKNAEDAFLNIYCQSTRPVSLLEAAIDQTVKVAKACELKAELQRMHINKSTSLKAVKKKAESHIKQLEQKEKVTQK
ncbi:hypothetical protein WOLCODRAFT_157878 [Wolfiporia cocos MD-104 SS10]|uniref:Cux N-terminal domain-containing protein n=1 Tax=Wolfiporia cocos (strain MD-104) TaxID=742152 RepID=A0A2H3J683_WOLCO|nr:hypothetical protein WOLCODRAFT_157878 [Wolfiporia cocos MD-104 SS10]